LGTNITTFSNGTHTLTMGQDGTVHQHLNNATLDAIDQASLATTGEPIFAKINIGTTSQNTLVEVVGGADTSETALMTLRSNYSGANTATTLRLINNTVATSRQGVEISSVRMNGANGASDLVISTYSGAAIVEALRLTSTRNLGLGKIPSAKLDIANSNTALFYATNTGASSSSAGAGIIGYHDDGAAMASGHRLGFFLLGGAEDAASTMSNASGFSAYATEDWTSSANGSDFRIETVLTGAGSRTERARFTGGGDFGIGTTAPDKKVEINSATGACLRLTYNDSNGSATYYTDYSVSSAGVATIAPSAAILNVTGDVRPTTDNTYYLGKNDDDTPQAWKGIILKDQAGTGKYYRLEVYDNALRIVDLTD
jgi:hypothetical protein